MENKAENRELVDCFMTWSVNSQLTLIVNKTREINEDFRIKRIKSNTITIM